MQPWGLSYAPNGFRVCLNATDPLGRGRVRLQVQACPPGVPFTHTTCISRTSAAWTDVTTASRGITLTMAITGLTNKRLYRWRERVLYGPFHGPWRRFLGQALEADLRVGMPPIVYLPIIMKSYR